MNEIAANFKDVKPTVLSAARAALKELDTELSARELFDKFLTQRNRVLANALMGTAQRLARLLPG